MMIWRRGVVTALTGGWDGVQELQVQVSEPIQVSEPVPVSERSGTRLAPGTDPVRALAYLDLTGPGQVGDAVLLSSAALHRGLGTGGYAFVVAFPDRLPADPPPSPGHIVKARYTPLQTLTLGVDEQESPHHEVLREATDLAGLPVIVADLHSALPAIIAGIRADRPDARIAYIMTDGGALPMAFSRTVSDLRAAGWLAATITVGQAYGGEFEAVNIHTGLLAAAHVVGADVAIVCQGPGNLGTGTTWGFSGTSAGEALNAAGVLGGIPVGSLRISGADARPRHRGVSHHSLTVYDKVALVPITVAVPDLPGELGAQVRAQAGALPDRHTKVVVDTGGLDAALAASPVHLSTMGRGLAEDPTPFIAGAAAGRYVAQELLGT